MANSQEESFLPDYATSPGEVLLEYLDAYQMDQKSLAQRINLTPKTIHKIIQGEAPISHTTALSLEYIFQRPAHFWTNLENLYQEDKARLAENARLQLEMDNLQHFPYTHMVALGWIAKQTKKIDKVKELCRFYKVNSLTHVDTLLSQQYLVYRQTRKTTADAKSMSAWAQQGEIEASKLACAPFDAHQFKVALSEIRTFTALALEQFRPKLRDICAQAGVAVVIVQALPKTGICGASRWIKGKAVIQLSLRHKSNDQLWFTFFHEAGHILKHGRKEVFFDDETIIHDNIKEEEANQFARDMLIPAADYHTFLQTWDGHTLAPIKQFAQDVGIHPGIVVGRLQHEKRLPYEHGQKLKIYYKKGAK